jgi:hypothetical protein
MKRRAFISQSITVAAAAGLSPALVPAARAEAATGREYYELRVYRLKAGASTAALESYLEKAAIPALNRLGIKTIGVFSEIEPKEAPAIFMLLPSPDLTLLTSAWLRLSTDAAYRGAAAAYLETPKGTPAFERIDSWLMLAFAGMPHLGQPEYCKNRKPRLFELRTYESYSEAKAQKKVDMFNNGEVDTMLQVGLGPIFFGQALTGPNLPHLTYMTSGENADAHKTHWDAFGKHPVWEKLKNDPQYADTVSKMTKWMLKPTAYSQI